MTQVRDFLDRFRPAGAPGSAARAGVPADRTAEISAELGPVLAVLDDVAAECARTVAQARREADRITREAGSRAAAIEAEGAARAQLAREGAGRELVRQADEQAREEIAAARKEAARIRRRARARLPMLVSRAVDLVRDPDGPPS